MTLENFNEYAGNPKRRPKGLDTFAKICLWCKMKFYPLNRKRKYCCDYCKHCYHYEKFKEEHKNDKLFLDANYNNYKVLKSFDELGVNVVSERDLMIKKFISNITPFYILVDGKMTAVFNNYGLYATENKLFQIIKISQWQQLN